MRIVSLLAILISTTALATQALAGPITADSSVDDVLDALDARGKDLKTLSADVKMMNVDSLGETENRVRLGHLYYQTLNNNDTRFRALFDKIITGKTSEEQKHDWLFKDGVLIDRDYHAKTQATRQVVRPGEKLDLFKLGGPFPLPLGQSKDDVHKSFDVKKDKPAKDDPAGSVHLDLKPIKGTDLARKFAKIDIWVDPATSLPARIDAADADGSSARQTWLSNIKVNEPIADDKFQMEQVDMKKDGWNETDERMR